MQLATLCGQDILLIIYDQEFQKIYQYKSSDGFDVDAAKKLLEQGTRQNGGAGARGKRKQQAGIKVYDYSNRDLRKFAKDDDVEQAEDEEGQDLQGLEMQDSESPVKKQSSIFGSKHVHVTKMDDQQKNSAQNGLADANQITKDGNKADTARHSKRSVVKVPKQASKKLQQVRQTKDSETAGVASQLNSNCDHDNIPKNVYRKGKTIEN